MGIFNNHISISFVNSGDIALGNNWTKVLEEAVKTDDCGLLCVTPDNVNSEWLVFEAGILSSNVKLLIPLLFGVSALQLGTPLHMFQSVPFGVDGMRELVCQLNNLCGYNGVSAYVLEDRFKALYPTLEMLVKEKLSEHGTQTPDNWKRAISTVDSKLDAILSQLSELKQKSVPSNPPRLNREAGL